MMAFSIKFINQQWPYDLGGKVIAEAPSEKAKKYNHIYDDETIENMVRYYKIEDNFDSLLRYIKRHRLNDEV